MTSQCLPESDKHSSTVQPLRGKGEERARGHARALNAQAGSTRDTWRQAMRHGRSKVVLRCQNKFCFGVALGEVSLDHAFHISAWLAPNHFGSGAIDSRN